MRKRVTLAEEDCPRWTQAQGSIKEVKATMPTVAALSDHPSCPYTPAYLYCFGPRSGMLMPRPPIQDPFDSTTSPARVKLAYRAPNSNVRSSGPMFSMFHKRLSTGDLVGNRRRNHSGALASASSIQALRHYGYCRTSVTVASANSVDRRRLCHLASLSLAQPCTGAKV